ncbi:MAG: hypothetical protein PHG66_02755 [Candidatus Colwellbacteria bacterium]|nr:hypothetical protein [Candidatus Colwellbacteria bacterium]
MSLWSLINFGNVAFLAVALICIFIKEPIFRIGALLIAALLIKFRPGIDIENLLFISSVLVVMVLEKVLPFRPRVNVWIGVVIGFVIFNIGLAFIK